MTYVGATWCCTHSVHAGRSLPYGSGGQGAGWTSASAMDMLDITHLPLAYAADEPSAVRTQDVTYAPWDGPQGYIPVSRVKVFQPGLQPVLQEASLVARPSMLGSMDGLSIVKVTGHGQPGSSSDSNGRGRSNGKSSGSRNSDDIGGSTD